MTSYQKLQALLQANPKTWLITGVAEVIGSNLLGTLLKLNPRLIGLDNAATGHLRWHCATIEKYFTPYSSKLWQDHLENKH